MRHLALPAVVGADSLLARLDFPREGTAGLERGRQVLTEALQRSGIEPAASLFTAHADRAVVAGIALLAGGLCGAYAACTRAPAAARRRGTAGALVLVVLGLLALCGTLDPLLPPTVRTNLAAQVEPRGALQHEILLVAHYDSKSEWLDHRGRGALAAAAVFFALLGLGMELAKRRRRARGRERGLASPRRPLFPTAVALAAALATSLLGVQLVSSRFLAGRSHGLVDDGAACALLVEMAGTARAAPLEHARLSFLWTAGEEIGAQGAAAACLMLGPSPPDLVLNLELLGGAPDLGVALVEWTGAGFALAPAGWVQRIETFAGTPLQRLPLPVVTDAGPFRRAGIPALTLLGVGRDGLPQRGLHGRGDRRAALDPAAQDRARRTLWAILAGLDAPPASPGSPRPPNGR